MQPLIAYNWLERSFETVCAVDMLASLNLHSISLPVSLSHSLSVRKLSDDLSNMWKQVLQDNGGPDMFVHSKGLTEGAQGSLTDFVDAGGHNYK